MLISVLTSIKKGNDGIIGAACAFLFDGTDERNCIGRRIPALVDGAVVGDGHCVIVQRIVVRNGFLNRLIAVGSIGVAVQLRFVAAPLRPDHVGIGIGDDIVRFV